VFGWEASCSTGAGTVCSSATVSATTTTGYFYTNAPYTTATNCGTREAKLRDASNGDVVVDTDECPASGPSSTPVCCLKRTENNLTTGHNYWVSATRSGGGSSSCGPVSAKISSVSYDCNSN
jgi:hypothetical protein